MPGYHPVAKILIWCLTALGSAAAQNIALRGGESQLEQASGAGVTLSYSSYSLDVFGGSFLGRIQTGAALKGDFSKYHFVAGDQMLQIVSPVYGDQSRGFYASGVSVGTALGKRFKLDFFAGDTGNTRGSQLFEVVRLNQPIGSVQLAFELNDKVSLFSRSLFSSRQSVIGGFDFHPNRQFHFGAQGGIGSNTPYGAVTASYTTNTSTLDGSYVKSEPQFRMVQINTLNFQEPIKENIHVHHKFDGMLQADYRRSNFQFSALDGAISQYSGNTISLTGRLWKTGWSAGYNQLSGYRVAQGVKTLRNGQQVNFGLNRTFGIFGINALQYRPISAPPGSSLQSYTTIMVQERMNRWFSLRQIASRSSNWGIAYGGEVHNNLMSVSLDYQTAYILFQPGQSQFTQGAVIEGNINLPFGGKLYVNTEVTPDGRFFYGWGMRSSFVGPYGRGKEGTFEVGSDDAPQMPRYVVWGKVLDADTGKTVPDFPMQVGAQSVFTNENGEFSIRLFSGRQVVASPDILLPHAGYSYVLVDGPNKVKPNKNAPGEEYVWRIRKDHVAATTSHGGLIIVGAADDKGAASSPPAPTAQLPGDTPSPSTTPAGSAPTPGSAGVSAPSTGTSIPGAAGAASVRETPGAAADKGVGGNASNTGAAAGDTKTKPAASGAASVHETPGAAADKGVGGSANNTGAAAGDTKTKPAASGAASVRETPGAAADKGVGGSASNTGAAAGDAKTQPGS